MNLLDAIAPGALVGFDSAPFIYVVEAHPDFAPILLPLFRDRLEAALNTAVTSVISLAEVVIMPMRAGRPDLLAHYRDLLTSTSYLQLVDLTVSVAESAADFRVRYNLRLPDALQIAASVQHGASYFVTNDHGLRRVTEVQVLVLSDYLPATTP